MSGFGRDKEGAPAGNEKVAKYVQRQIAAKGIPTGDITLRPGWRYDYVQLVREYLNSVASSQ